MLHLSSYCYLLHLASLPTVVIRIIILIPIYFLIKAYSDLVKKQGKEDERLPGLKFTPEQLFFITFAQVCMLLLSDGLTVNKDMQTGKHTQMVTQVLRDKTYIYTAVACACARILL